MSLPALRRFGVAPLAVAAAVLVRLLSWRLLGPELPFLLLWPAVMFCAWYGGLGPGLLATLLGAVAAALLFFEPTGSLASVTAEGWLGMAAFVGLGAVISLLTEGLHRARRWAEEADRRKDEFLAMLAHELRNPLAPLRTAAEILRLAEDGETGPAREVIERQVRQMTCLVDDLLDLSRITRGKVLLEMGRVALAAVVGAAVENARPLIEARRHRLTVALPPEPVWLHADPTRLTQVFANLLNNAAKYTESGGQIRLTAERDGGAVVVRVRDSGVGIAPDTLPHVFDLFAQAERSLGLSEGGLGVGLTLVRRLVELHGGSVTAHSEGAGQGSEFVVRLPFQGPLSLVPCPLSRAEHKGQGTRDKGQGTRDKGQGTRRILVVDDNKDSADTLAHLLTLLGHEARTAYDGEAALEAAPLFRPEVVLLDLNLPGLSGLEVARRLRERGEGAFRAALT
ncbi:MAG TPA: ATP-binding protein, partial [Gemmataceae bacterium]|nr:ATP-binding protein [Gemmataceae bacterium]